MMMYNVCAKLTNVATDKLAIW